MAMYKSNPQADASRTESLMICEFPPLGLVELFGQAPWSDGHKVSGKYVFTSDRGEIFTVYDWKQTTLYGGADSTAPMPEEFWRMREPQYFHIGGTAGSHPRRFINWLQGLYTLHMARRAAALRQSTSVPELLQRAIA